MIKQCEGAERRAEESDDRFQQAERKAEERVEQAERILEEERELNKARVQALKEKLKENEKKERKDGMYV